ncbi:LppX_LprAFG lipoprotein [Terrabacter sp. NPDC080008]|uniref:LppX_LprAFG lipoprotein n=1 Tax=Terrabacter sp. NPDC080008 TaxID=3155176 RepID=UPI00344C7BF9
MRLPGKLAAAGLSALCVVTAASCSSSDEGGAPGQTQLSPAQRLAAAKAKVDAAPSVHLQLASSEVPQGASGVVSADGWGKHPPAFKGTFKVSLKGVQADAEITSLGGDVYAKLPLIPGTNKIDPKAFNLPDPAVLFSPDTGLTTLLTATTSPTAGGQVRRGADVLSTIKGALPGKAVTDLFLIGDPNGSYSATYGLTDSQELRQVSIAGPFFGSGTTSTYTLVLDQYGKPVTITRP